MTPRHQTAYVLRFTLGVGDVLTGCVAGNLLRPNIPTKWLDVEARFEVMGSSGFSTDLSLIVTLVGTILALVAILISFLLWRYPRGFSHPGRYGACVAFAVLLMLLSVPTILLPVPAEASVLGGLGNVYVSCGSLVQPRTDFSQYPVSPLSITASSSEAQGACQSTHDSEIYLAALCLACGAGMFISLIVQGAPSKSA
jgi:hypothetical protein